MDASNWSEIADNAAREGRVADAITAWREQLWLRPNDHTALHALLTLYKQTGEMRQAIELLQAAIRREYEYADAHQWLGELFMELAEWDKAQLHFTHAGADDLLRELEQKRQALPPSYARHLFNDYAPRFDVALAGLGYQAPKLLGEALAPYLAGKAGLRIIDLGCGTGLMAPYLRPYASHLVGVDIAERMLEQARARGGYNELIAADMVDVLAGAYELVVAADALVYVGALETLFARLPRGAHFAASVEVNGLQEGFVLQGSKRYAHSQNYIKALCYAHNCELLVWHPCAFRQDRGTAIQGAIFIAHAK